MKKNAFVNRVIKSIPERLRKIEFLYAFTSLVFGLFFIAIIPPGWNPDEPQHYWRVQSLSHGNMFADIYKDGDSVYAGGPLTVKSLRFITSYGGTADKKWPDNKINFPMTDNEGAYVTERDTGATYPAVFSATSKNTPFVYLPYVVTAWIGNTLGLPLLITFLLAKVAGLLTLTLAFFYAIRIIPKGKWIVLAIGLLPTTIVQSTAITADVMTLGSCILFIALVTQVAFSKQKISTLTYVALAGLVVAISLVKPSYLPIVAYVLVIPFARKDYRSIKILAVSAIALGLCAIPGVLWFKAMISAIPDYYPGNVIPTEQLENILANPLSFLKVLFITYFSDDQQIIHRGVFGSFIWDTVKLPLLFNYLGIAALTLTLLISSTREQLNARFSALSKLTMWAIFILLSAIITFGLYIYYTTVGNPSSVGIQGRYFLPFAPLVLLALHSPVIAASKQFKIKLWIYGIFLSMLVAACVVIFGRIYG